LDGLLHQVWRDHPHYYRLDNEGMVLPPFGVMTPKGIFRQTVVQIITSPTVNAILKVFSYAPTLEADQVEPLALLDQPVAMPI
jgi:uncharacterized membrane protein YqaE (UPF0057 family)